METRIIKVSPSGGAGGGKGAGGRGELAAALGPAVRAMRAGRLVVFPTETVYGVGVVATDARAVERLRKLKERPRAAFTVHIARPEDAFRYVKDPPVRARALMAKAWPGPVTVLLPVGGRFADPALRSKALYRRMVQDDVVGLRCPADPVAQALLAAVGKPVLAASANLAGQPAPGTAGDALEQLDGRVNVVIDAGRTRYRQASTIVAFEGEQYRLVRAGVYDAAAVERLMRRRVLFVCTGNTCRSPLAAALARKLLAERMGLAVDELCDYGQEVVSAGVSAFAGGRATPEAVAAAERFGASLEGHRSRKLTNELIKSADLIFCMTERHVAEVTRRVPSAAARTFLLDAAGDIADPIGGDVETYCQIAGRIVKALRRRMKENLL